MKLLAAGLNNHRQLTSDVDETLTAFEHIHANIENLILPTWSSLAVQTTSGNVLNCGHEAWSSELATDIELHSAIGDHNGFLAAVDTEGRLHVPHRASEGVKLRSVANGVSPTLIHLTMSDIGRIACAYKQASSSQLRHTCEFLCFSSFMQWYEDPSSPANRPVVKHSVSGRITQLLAGASTFAMLMQNHELFTWGDPRHRSLARSTVGEGSTSAETPGLVDALAGLELSKIAIGGWMGGAITLDGAAYLWGTGMPGKQLSIRCLKDLKQQERVVLVEVTGSIDDEPDIVDVAIGDGHVALLTADGRVYVAGENKHGQLGLDITRTYVEEWTQVPDLVGVKQVVCGPKSTFLLVDE